MSETTPAPEQAGVEKKAVKSAIAKAQRVLWQTQKQGFWDAQAELGPWCTAQVLITLKTLGKLYPRDAEEARRWILSQQRQDGSFVVHPFAKEGEVGATAVVWAALRICGAAQNEEPVKKAWSFIQKSGGLARVKEAMQEGDLSGLFVAVAGLLEPKELPKPPLFFVLVPQAIRFLQKRFNAEVILSMLQLGILSRRLSGDWGELGDKKGFLGAQESRRCLEILDTLQNENGSINDLSLSTLLALLTFWAIGLPVTDARITRALSWLEQRRMEDAEGLRFSAFGSSTWSTASNARALLLSGVPRQQPNLLKAVEALLDNQCQKPQPPLRVTREGAPRSGGWAYQLTNQSTPDCDDTAAVLELFGLLSERDEGAEIDEALAARIRRASQKGLDWLLGMQNPDGGWPGFAYGLPPKPPGPIMTRPTPFPTQNPLASLRFFSEPPVELGDPSVEDLTGRALKALGEQGYTTKTPAVARAIEFLRRQQLPDGPWWGRWGVNYLASTSYILLGLSAVGADLDDLWTQRALGWILAHQNPDGGFGETVESYRDPSLAGLGESVPALTGLVLSALCVAGRGYAPAADRAARYLLAQQHADGTWSEEGYLTCFFPPRLFNTYPPMTRFLPLEALGRYLARSEGSLSPPAPEARFPDGFLDEKRQSADPPLDALVEEIFSEGSGAVSKTFLQLIESDALAPPDLPKSALDYFGTKLELPGWADPERIDLSQKLFTRVGWGVAMGLFFSALPQAYAAARGARVLVFTTGMTRFLRRRIFETAQFVFDVMDEGAFAPAGRGFRAIQKVRLMHAAVRSMALKKGDWRPDEWGLPINQEDLSGTLMTFSVVTLDAMKRLGYPVSPEEESAWLHTWTVVGHFLGINEDLLPQNIPDGEALMEAIRRRQWAPSSQGKALAGALIELFQEQYREVGLGGMPVTMVRYLAGDHCADILGLPRSDWTRFILTAGAEIQELLSGKAGEARLPSLFQRGVHSLMQMIVTMQREGKNVPFRLPKALQ